MQVQVIQIDAFTSNIFHGNPACVVPLQEWLPDKLLLKIARQNGVPETAYFIVDKEKVLLRWFTPDIEMDLCGHATLATAHCLKTILNYSKTPIVFETASGALSVTVENDLYCLDFPSRMPIKADLPDFIKNSLNIQPIEVLKSRDYVLVYKSEDDIRNIIIDRNQFDQINLDPGGVIVTARGKSCDFVSRFFTPQSTILEDPVTGSAHCSLIPFWSKKLNKTELTAQQLSERGGILYCVNQGGRVLIKGEARTYMEGSIKVE